MEKSTIQSTPFSSFKSKKPLLHSDQKVSQSEPDPLTVKTPGKPVDPPRTARRRTAVMSIHQVRQAALKLREQRSDSIIRPDTSLGSGKEPVTPTKKKKRVDAEIKLPEKYVLLEEFFNGLESSIRLLRLKGSMATFTNIGLQVQCLTERRFTHCHLAQLKFVMPEVIVIEKTLQYDEKTCCMRPDLLVSLNLEACDKLSKVESHNKYLHLRKLFHERLLDHFKSHPQDDDLPEEALPELFNRVKEDARVKSCQASASTPTSGSLKEPIAASLLSPSFRRSFAKRALVNGTQNTAQQQSDVPVPIESKSEFAGVLSTKELSTNKSTPTRVASSSLHETPVKAIGVDLSSIGTSANLKTPAETVSTPARLMSSTPMLNPPKRCHMSPVDNSYKSPSKLIRRQPANRPLTFDTPVKRSKVDETSPHDDILDILSPALISSIREKENNALMELDPAISQAKRRRKMIAGLPKLFDSVYFFFQSKNRSVVTKEELMHNVISDSLQIMDKDVVEEQIKLLQELAPEWINEKASMSGDLLLCISKNSSPAEIRTRLLEAK